MVYSCSISISTHLLKSEEHSQKWVRERDLTAFQCFSSLPFLQIHDKSSSFRQSALFAIFRQICCVFFLDMALFQVAHVVPLVGRSQCTDWGFVGKAKVKEWRSIIYGERKRKEKAKKNKCYCLQWWIASLRSVYLYRSCFITLY